MRAPTALAGRNRDAQFDLVAEVLEGSFRPLHSHACLRRAQDCSGARLLHLSQAQAGAK